MVGSQFEQITSNNNFYSDTLSKFGEVDKKQILAGKDNVIIESKEQLRKLVEEALSKEKSRKNLYLGVIPNNTIIRIKNEAQNIKQERLNTLFKDNMNYALAITQDEIRHIKKESLTIDDVVGFVDSLDELIANFDDVTFTLYNNSQNALRFKKTMNDGTHIALEVISNKKHTFRTHTLFLEKADFENKKRNISPTFDKQNMFPEHTSKMDGASVSLGNNIPQSNSNVKSDKILPTKYDMQKSENNTIAPVNQKNVIMEEYQRLKSGLSNATKFEMDNLAQKIWDSKDISESDKKTMINKLNERLSRNTNFQDHIEYDRHESDSFKTNKIIPIKETKNASIEEINNAINNDLDDYDGRFNTNDNCENLYDKIYHHLELEKENKLSDSDYELINEQLENFYKDGFYVEKIVIH